MAAKDIIAARFGHAFVVHVWKAHNRKRLERVRFRVAWQWEELEARAVEAVKAHTGGAWPMQGYFPCPPELSGEAKYDFDPETRTAFKRWRREHDQETARQNLIVDIEGRFMVCVPIKDSRGRWAWLPAQNWEALEGEARESVRNVFFDKAGRMMLRRQWSCPAELSARAIAPGQEQDKGMQLCG